MVDWTTQMTEANQWIQKANATWWPVWGTWMSEWETNKGEWEEITNTWGEEMNSSVAPVWATWMEQWDSKFALWEEKYGDKAWWPMWSMWMKEWKNMMTTNKWSTMPLTGLSGGPCPLVPGGLQLPLPSLLLLGGRLPSPPPSPPQLRLRLLKL